MDRRVIIVRGEIEDYALVERIINEYEIQTVFHLGAQTIVTIANRSLSQHSGQTFREPGIFLRRAGRYQRSKMLS
jgi:nucleoside-diphosphate-sugar epimerase